MRLTVEATELLAALALCNGVVKRATTIPILAHLLLSAAGSGLAIVATNLDFQMSAQAAANVDAAGSITAPASMLHDLVKSFPVGADILLDDAETPNRLTVRCGASQYRLPTLPAGDFPVMSEDGPDEGGDLDAAELRRMLTKALPSASTEQVRCYLNGVHLRPGPDGKLRAEATDGKRAARIDGPVAAGFVLPFQPDILVFYFSRYRFDVVLKIEPAFPEIALIFFNCECLRVLLRLIGFFNDVFHGSIDPKSRTSPPYRNVYAIFFFADLLDGRIDIFFKKGRGCGR